MEPFEDMVIKLQAITTDVGCNYRDW